MMQPVDFIVGRLYLYGMSNKQTYTPEEIQAIKDKDVCIRTREERMALKKEIKPFCNHMGYSDQFPYEVVRVVSHRCVEVREMDATQVERPQHFIQGGFSAHCVDNHAQKWECTSNEENPVFKVRWSNANERWQDRYGRRFMMHTKPSRHHDYNF